MITSFLILTGDDETPEPPVKVSNITPESIDSITIIREGKEGLDFTNHQDTWQMTSPRTAAANHTRINAILFILQSRSYAQLYAKELNLSRFELRDPAITLKLNEYEFFFGGTDPLEYRRYLLFEDTVHLINDNLFHQLQQPPEFFLLVKNE